MADDRRREVEVGAGLQESRLNEDFIEGLKKHGPKVIYALAAVVLMVYGMSAYKNFKANQKDEAFAQLDSATGPESLIRVADETTGEASVSLMARLEAANALMDSARARVRAGVVPTEAKPEDMLSDAQVQEQYRAAVKELEAVVTATKDGEKPLILQAARWGLVTAKMSLGETEAAKKIVTDYVTFADAHGLKSQAALGRQRLETIENPVQPKMATEAQVTPAGQPVADVTATPAAAAAEPRKTPMGNKLNEEGQAALDAIMKGDRGLPEGWKRTETDILIPVRNDEGDIIAYYTKSSYDRGAIDERWIRVLWEDMRGSQARAEELREQINFEDGLLTKPAEKKKPADQENEEAPKSPATSGG